LYEDAEEKFSIQVSGSDAADTWVKLEALSAILDKAERWGRGENMDVVTLQYTPTDGTYTLVAPIIGAPRQGKFLTLPPNADYQAATNKAIGNSSRGITLSFVRRGKWLRSTQESKSSSASTGNPEIVTVATFSTAAAIPSPIDVEIDFGSTGTLFFTEMWAIFTDNSSKIALLEAEDGIGTVGTSSVTDNASEGKVAIIDTAGQDAGYEQVLTYNTGTFDSFDSTARLFQIYAAVRQRNVANTYLLRAELLNRTKELDSDVVALTRSMTVDGDDVYPAILPLGIFALPDSLSKYGIDVYGSGVSISSTSTTFTMEIDYLVVQAIDDATNTINVKGEVQDAQGGPATGTGILKLIVNHRLDTHLYPEVYGEGLGNERIDLVYGGDALISSLNSTVHALVMGAANSGFGEDNYFLTATSSSTAQATFTVNIDRNLGFLTPQ